MYRLFLSDITIQIYAYLFLKIYCHEINVYFTKSRCMSYSMLQQI